MNKSELLYSDPLAAAVAAAAVAGVGQETCRGTQYSLPASAGEAAAREAGEAK